MKTVVGRDRMRQLEKETIQELGLPALLLMEQAAAALAAAIERRLEERGAATKRLPLLFLCGSGNNGADALAAARYLQQRGYFCITACSSREGGTEEYLLQRRINDGLGIERICWQEALQRLHQSAQEERPSWAAIVDGLFGIGLSRPVEGEAAELLIATRACPCLKVAADIPSGLDADTGQVLGAAFLADVTVTFGFAKLGLFLHEGMEHAGEIVVAPLTLAKKPETEGAQTEGVWAWQLEREELPKYLPERRVRSHKASYGKVLIVAGSYGMAGAAYLCGAAAFACGCGMVRILTPECNREILQVLLPEAILSVYEEEIFDVDAVAAALSWADSLVIGPGLGMGAQAKRLLNYLLQYAKIPVVVDADALNLLAEDPELLSLLRGNRVITPHLGELSRLTARPVEQLQKSLAQTARECSETWGCVCLCKDAVSLVAEPGGGLFVNNSGCSGMATAGSGDVLSGIIGALLGGGSRPVFAAVTGAFVHGLAGRAAAEKEGDRGMTASHLLEGLRQVLR